MRIWKYFVTAAVWALLPSIILANTLGHDLKQIIAKVEPSARVGVVVGDLKHGKVLYEHHPNQYFSPASIIKVYTAIRALNQLGGGFRYHTWLLSDASSIEKGVLKGDLFIRFGGDPSFQSINLQLMLAALKSMGIDQIQGHVWIDDSAFNQPFYPPGRVWDDLGYGYGAPISSVIIDRNQWRLYISPAQKSGQAGLLGFSHWAHQMKIDNQITTTSGWAQQCPITIYSLGPNHLRVAGCIPKPSKNFYRQLAFTNPVAIAQLIAQDTLAELHIPYKGAVGIKSAPDHASYLIFQSSPPLSVLLATMLKDSENIYAGSLLKVMNQMSDHSTGDHPGLDKNIPQGAFRLSDGSGLSRYNRITPLQMHQALLYAYQHPKIYRVLLDDLATPGGDGTLKKRTTMKSIEIYAKTGSMTSVQALTGYLYTSSHKKLDFVIMANDFVMPRGRLIQLENLICKRLSQEP